MEMITDIASLEALYEAPSPRSIEKVVDHLTPKYRAWVEASRFVVLATMGAARVDVSPRGDISPVSQVIDPKTILLPDWRGNNRLDSLRNIVSDGHVSLMYMIPGSPTVVRVIGHAQITIDEATRNRFSQDGKTPRSVIVVTVSEVYFQCAKALMRAEIWDGRKPGDDVPTAGDFLKEKNKDFDGKAYDDGYEAYAQSRMW